MVPWDDKIQNITDNFSLSSVQLDFKFQLLGVGERDEGRK